LAGAALAGTVLVAFFGAAFTDLAGTAFLVLAADFAGAVFTVLVAAFAGAVLVALAAALAGAALAAFAGAAFVAFAPVVFTALAGAAFEALAGADLVAFLAGTGRAAAFLAGVLVAGRFTGFLVAGLAFVATTYTLSVLLATGRHARASPKASAMWNIGVIS
jgi:hypothetical protein